MEHLQAGDVVRIKSDYLEEGEDPDRDYVVLENYENGTIRIYTKTYEYQIGTANTIADYMVYKVGHINLKK